MKAIKERINNLATSKIQQYLMLLILVTLGVLAGTAMLVPFGSLREIIFMFEVVAGLAVGIAGLVFCNYSEWFERKVCTDWHSDNQKTIQHLRLQIKRLHDNYEEGLRDVSAMLLNFNPAQKDAIKTWAIKWFEGIKLQTEESKVRLESRMIAADKEIIDILQMRFKFDEVKDEAEEILLDFISGIQNSDTNPEYAESQLRPLIEQHALIYLNKNIDWYEELIASFEKTNQQLVKFLDEEHDFVLTA